MSPIGVIVAVESYDGRKMRGYFGIGVEGLSKPMNAGNLFRS
ncbi:uncharacterized protein METZ01_LOCUS141336, partial [marine metagenome]